MILFFLDSFTIMNTRLVFGGGGHVGRHVCKELVAQYPSDLTVALTRTPVLKSVLPHGVSTGVYDVTSENSVSSYGHIRAIIYCVGHCPTRGFAEAVRAPLSDYPSDGLLGEMEMHVFGVHRIFQKFLPLIDDGGSFTFMSSAATRLLLMPLLKRPPLHIYHHLAAVAAGQALVEGMRMDPAVKERGIKIHQIMPPAIIDSPFHENGPELPTTVTTRQVVDTIVSKALPADVHGDFNMVYA